MTARASAEEARKRNIRLEAYLKRVLDVDSFERIRAHEDCIVCSEKEDKAFKFIVLSDEWIYLSENPPKKLLKAIHLKDVTTLEVLPDKPSFLSGEEKENSQHLRIEYLTDEVGKKAANKGDSDSLEKYPSPVKDRHGALSYTALHYTDYPDDCWPSSARSTARSTYRERSLRKNSMLQTGSDISALQITQNSTAEDKIKPSSLSIKLKNSARKNEATKIRFNVTDENGRTELLDIPEGQATVQKSTLDLKNGKKYKRNRSTQDKSTDDDSSKEMGTNKNLLIVPRIDVADHDDDDDSFQDDLRLTIEMESEELALKNRLRTAKIDIYLRRANSTMLMLIRCAWNNYVIRDTLEQSPQVRKRCENFPPRSGPGVRFEYMNFY